MIAFAEIIEVAVAWIRELREGGKKATPASSSAARA
jgi:hypothetical protein